MRSAIEHGSVETLYHVLKQRVALDHIGFTLDGIDYRAKDVRISFAIDEYMYCYEIPSLDLFYNFTEVVKYNNKKRCLICYEKSLKV